MANNQLKSHFYRNLNLNAFRSMYDCYSEACESGLQIEKLLSLEYDNLEMDHKIVASENIPNEAILAQIPVELGINGNELYNFRKDEAQDLKEALHQSLKKMINYKSDGIAYEKALQHAFLICQCIACNKKGEFIQKSLVQSFSKNMNSLLSMDQASFSKIKSRSIGKNLMLSAAPFMRVIHDLNNNKINQSLRISTEVFEYYNMAVNKYKHTIEYEKGIISLVNPFINLIKPKSNGNVDFLPIYDEHKNYSTVIVIATRPIEKGEVLSFSYNDFSNLELAIRYGEIDLDNPNRYIECNLSAFENDWNFYFEGANQKLNELRTMLASNLKLKQKLCEYKGYEPYERIYSKAIKFYSTRFDVSILKYLRIGFLTSEELSVQQTDIFAYDFNKKWSTLNEKKAYEYLEQIVNYYYEPLKDLNFEQLLVSEGTNYKQWMLIKLEEEEKKILDSNATHLIKKINSLI